MRKIKKLLVANRGEIALRIMRTAKEMGIQTVAVFSQADRNAPFVRFADEAFCIGPPKSSESYLNVSSIKKVIKETKVDAVHPGYGFLSENADFAAEIESEGVIFIGPKPESIVTMGSKLEAKKLAKKHNIPLVPGTDTAIESIPEAKKIATKAGYPILIKASAGGGGKGMRIVENEREFESQMERAVSEAISSFGDGAVFIEKYVQKPRHIEIQILADSHGNTLYLFERECSIQRRHQKVVEEAPSSVLTPKLRKEMGECAVRIAKACNYVGAGTVEFLLDEDLNFYFLEMNTRLQVEHPVTEMITGIDLVEQQIKIAEGSILELKQEDLQINGHAFELRVYAEDPLNNFLPDIGTLQVYREPSGEGIRVDAGFEEGMPIPIHYDPMIAKLVCYSSTREKAIQKSIRAIDEYQINGVETTLPFCKYVLKHDAFVSGDFDTNFVSTYFKSSYEDPLEVEEQEVLSILSSYLLEEKIKKQKVYLKNESNWKNLRK